MSLSARRAWIEIEGLWLPMCWCSVALRKESVDRNFNVLIPASSAAVALRKESVDRNKTNSLNTDSGILVSLSARRAWIEICTHR